MASRRLKDFCWLPDMTFNEALDHAIEHFKTHHEDYTG
jgi:hypothetical protein